jgi:hypothetical protein
VLNQVLAAGPGREHGRLDLSRHVQLMRPGKDDLDDLLLLVPPGDQGTAQDFQPALARPYLFPQIGGAVAARIHRYPLRRRCPG